MAFQARHSTAENALTGPLPATIGNLTKLQELVAPLARAYRPDLVLVSAGFDAHADDPLAECRVSDAGFASMAAGVRSIALRSPARTGSPLSRPSLTSPRE